MSNNKNLTRGSLRPGWGLARVLAAVFWCCASPAIIAQEATGQSAQVKEYFHQQDASTALLLRLEVFEAGFESRVFDTEGVLLKASGVPSLQLGPIFQFIEPIDKPRQIRIEVTSGNSTSRSRVDLSLTRFEPTGPDATTLIKAYRLLSHGLEIEKSNHADKWTMKVVSLMQAANIFDFLGMQELQLWSEFYANYYLLVVLGDPITAAEGAKAIFPRANRAGLNSLALASLQLEGMALVKLAAGDAKAREAHYDSAQARFREAADLAASIDYQHEQARSVYISGLAFEYAGQVDQAFTQFDRALGIATAIDDTWFANQVRQHAAEMHESRGDTTEAIALLEAIRATAPPAPATEEETSEPEPEPGEKPDPVEARAQTGKARTDREMVRYLFEQGRLLEKTFAHLEAAEVLMQALELDQRAPTAAHTGPVTLLLGKALYGAGRMDAAAQYLKAATDKTTASGYRSELEEAYGMLASVFREQADFTSMREARESQQSLLASDEARAAFAYEQALDALAVDGASSAAARSFLAESARLASQGEAREVAQLALLQSCALGSCLPGSSEQALNALQASGLPAAAFQGRLLWAQILRRNGQLAESTAALGHLIDDMQFFHARLPGVLGAWYWQNREAIFTSFMDQTLQTTGVAAGGAGDDTAALRSLTVLDRLSGFDAGEDTATQSGTSGGDILARLRSAYAARAGATDPLQARTLGSEAAALLEQARATAGPAPSSSGSSPTALAAKLRELPPDAAFLTYYLSDRQAWAWVGRREGLSVTRLPWSDHQSADLSREIERLRLDLARGESASFTSVMDSLGQALLAPIARQLPGTIYFFPMGRMEGVPLDALRVNGAFLIEHHRVINLVSLDRLHADDSRVEDADLHRFYVAGNRQTNADDFGAYQPTPEEIRTVADRFVGPGLRIVQGSALHFEEFEDEQFTAAGVLHLAIPGVIDLRQPGESRLMLSDSTMEEESEVLLPGDIARKTFRARLVALSALDFAGASPSSFDTNTRFVREFLQAGAGSVIASLWTVGDRPAAEFWRRFYETLAVTPSVSDALYSTRRSYLEDGAGPESGVWAAFQLFAD